MIRPTLILSLLAAFLLVACSSTPDAGPVAVPDGPIAEVDRHDPFGQPNPQGDSADLDVRERLGYVRGFEKSWKVPAWVSYRIDGAFFEPGAPKHDMLGRFLPDPDLDGELRITHNHYAQTGFERCQLAPWADMQGRSPDVVRECYYMSNVAPCYPALGTRLWMNLESQVRKWAKKYGRVYVVTGPVFPAAGPAEWLTPAKPGLEEKIAVPSHFFKVVFRKTDGELHVLAFLVPNQEERFSDDWDFARWQVTVDEVELATSLDLMSRLKDSIETDVESREEPLWD